MMLRRGGLSSEVSLLFQAVHDFPSCVFGDVKMGELLLLSIPSPFSLIQCHSLFNNKKR